METAKPALTREFADRLGGPVPARALALKTLNLCLAKHHFLVRSAAVLSKPLGLVVDPINNCNLACPGCVHSTRSRAGKLFEWPSGMLSEDCFGSLMRRYGPWALELMLCNYGEPLMNPNTPKFIALARSYLMRTGLSTNMTSKRFDARAYAESGLDFMTISLDGATQAVYERYRREGDLEQAFANIRALVAAKRECGRENPILSWQFLAFEHNAHEIENAIAIARELGMDQFVVANPFDVGWDEPSIRPADTVKARTIHFKGNPEARMIANFNPAPAHLAEREITEAWEAGFGPVSDDAPGASAHSCQWLYRNMVLDATGRVLPCCAAPKPGFELVFDRFTAGSGDAFNSEKYRAARQWFRNPSDYQTPAGGDPYCTKCEWNQDTAHTDGAQVDQYLKTVPNAVFGDELRRLLAWD
jgi:MoaA/NifB/PqqE/SkfB family radical SAM enzyme